MFLRTNKTLKFKRRLSELESVNILDVTRNFPYTKLKLNKNPFFRSSLSKKTDRF